MGALLLTQVRHIALLDALLNTVYYEIYTGPVNPVESRHL